MSCADVSALDVAPAAAAAADVEAIRSELGHVTEQDLVDFAHCVPPGMAELVRVLGARLAVRMVDTWPGVLIAVPVADSRQASGIERRAELVRALGEADAAALCTAYGGESIALPVMRWLLRAKRQRWLRREFDAMPAGISKMRAVTRLGLRLGAAGLAMTSRQISTALDTPGTDASSTQIDLFGSHQKP